MTITSTTRPVLMTLAAAGVLVALTGCGSSATTADSASGAGATSSASAPGAAASTLITIKDFKYTLPGSVSPGAKIMVTNQDDQNHTVTSTPKGAFGVKVDGGGTASFTAPTKPGSYQIVCDFHANMAATLVVK